jgi:hypothetical protein
MILLYNFECRMGGIDGNRGEGWFCPISAAERLAADEEREFAHYQQCYSGVWIFRDVCGCTAIRAA